MRAHLVVLVQQQVEVVLWSGCIILCIIFPLGV